MGLLRKKTPPVPGRRSENSEQGREHPSLADLDSRYAFQRNRTLTGSLSSNVSSAVEHGAELKSARVHAHHLRRHRRYATAALFVVMVAGACLAFLIYQAIIDVSISTNAPGSVNDDAYVRTIREYLVKRPLERFRFSLNTGSLSSYLQAHGYPEVSSVSDTITFDGIGRASIHVMFRNPVVVWRTGGTALYVDAKGNTFQRNYYQDPSVQVVDQTGIAAHNNQVLASDYFLGFIGKVIGRMKEQGYEVTQITLPANTTRQVQLMVNGVGYPMKFSIDRPVGEQAEDAARAIRYLTSKGIVVQYLDVRVSGRVYYK